MLKDDSLTAKVQQSTEIHAIHKSLAREILDRNEKNKHNAALPKVNNFNPSTNDYDGIWKTPKIAEDLLASVHNRSSDDLRASLIQASRLQSEPASSIKSEFLGHPFHSRHNPILAISADLALTDQDYLTLLTQLPRLKTHAHRGAETNQHRV